MFVSSEIYNITCLKLHVCVGRGGAEMSWWEGNGFGFYLLIYLFGWLVASFPPKAPRVSGNAPASSHQMLYMSDSSEARNFFFFVAFSSKFPKSLLVCSLIRCWSNFGVSNLLMPKNTNYNDAVWRYVHKFVSLTQANTWIWLIRHREWLRACFGAYKEVAFKTCMTQ